MTTDIAPDVFTADYEGEPGQRAFYLQARSAAGNVTLGIEKAQVAALAEKLQELLLLVDHDDVVRGGTPARDPELALEPEAPGGRVGTIGLAYEEDDDRVVVLLQTGEDDDDEESLVRLTLRREQVRAFVLHAVAVVAEGRPLCQLCGLPMDPEGHACPASNGHRLGA
ncbi:MAG TPA: DUF3090 family protein [Actinomycetota bacterium]|nr:DUF3090 family protein [Actinomycetota bacterium]